MCRRLRRPPAHRRRADRGQGYAIAVQSVPGRTRGGSGAVLGGGIQRPPGASVHWEALWFNGRDYQADSKQTADPEFFVRFGPVSYDFSRKPAAAVFKAFAAANPIAEQVA